MITETNGDLLTCGADVLCHQTNYHGVMGAGVAAAIREQLLPPAELEKYIAYCKHMNSTALGTVQFIRTIYENQPRYIANCFSQNDNYKSSCLTDYGAFLQCMKTVEQFALRYHCSLALPGYMGCGIAGGEWHKVRILILEVFRNSSVPLTIVYRE